MKHTLKLLIWPLFFWMIYVVISTSLESNLFTEWNALAAIPWMRATLWDFYANVFAIFLWVCYKEKSIISKIIWLVLLVCLGSIATLGYVLIQLYKLQEDEPVSHIFTK